MSNPEYNLLMQLGPVRTCEVKQELAALGRSMSWPPRARVRGQLKPYVKDLELLLAPRAPVWSARRNRLR